MFDIIKLFMALPAAGLYAHTAQALAAGPVSAAIPNATSSINNIIPFPINRYIW